MSLITLTLVLTFLVAVRYLLIAGVFYLLFYFLKIERLQKLKIEKANPKLKIIKREIYWSLGTSIIFGFLGAVVFKAWQNGQTLIYFNESRYGWVYLFCSIGVAMFIHDSYFYWMHRIVHHPKLFPLIHRVHHDSNPPTPWAAFSFHWSESILEALIFPVLVFVLPLHIGAVLFMLVFMTITSVINHLGYETYPKWLRESKIGKYFISATHHQTHHSEFNSNYGLYFNYWDRWMKTQSKKSY
ncbi:MAG: sterol desaturase family protein [Xanthomonadaceae bacterium]|nr:sterol desaturase family protein [Xanthomonadaceae bacterium]